MQEIRYQDRILNGQKSTLEWKKVTDKDKLVVEVFETEKLFKNLGIYWKDLEKRADCRVYMSYDWAYTWWKHFGKNDQRSLYIVTFWDGTRIVGIAPFYKGTSEFGSLTLETRVQIIGSGGNRNEQIGYLDDYGKCDFLDIIVDRSYTDVVAEKLLEFIDSGSLRADVLKFHEADEKSFIMNHLYPRLKEMYPEMQIEHSDTCPTVDLGRYKSMKDYIKDQKSNARRRIRQTIRANGDKKEYVIRDAASDWESVEKAIENIIELHQSRWNRIGFPGIFYDERFTRFFKDTMKYAYDNGWLWFKEAIDEEGVCASRMILKYNNRYYDYISGFDELRPSSKYRPGIGLLVDLIEEGIAENADRLELLRGEEEYKYDFTSDAIKNWKLSIPLKDRKTNIPFWLNRMCAHFYKYYIRESELLKVQYQKEVGVLKALSGYINFRWTSLKMKLQS